jgi:uncharacterized protein YdbL (DUF1318 family)
MIMMNRKFYKTLIIAFAMSLMVSTAVASALDGPKAAGLIGEQANGYLGLVSQGASPEIKSLVKDVNAKRKNRYQSIAQKQGVPLSDVEKVGGATAIEKTLRGNYIKDSSGRWRKK